MKYKDIDQWSRIAQFADKLVAEVAEVSKDATEGFDALKMAKKKFRKKYFSTIDYVRTYDGWVSGLVSAITALIVSLILRKIR